MDQSPTPAATSIRWAPCCTRPPQAKSPSTATAPSRSWRIKSGSRPRLPSRLTQVCHRPSAPHSCALSKRTRGVASKQQKNFARLSLAYRAPRTDFRRPLDQVHAPGCTGVPRRWFAWPLSQRVYRRFWDTAHPRVSPSLRRCDHPLVKPLLRPLPPNLSTPPVAPAIPRAKAPKQVAPHAVASGTTRQIRPEVALRRSGGRFWPHSHRDQAPLPTTARCPLGKNIHAARA